VLLCLAIELKINFIDESISPLEYLEFIIISHIIIDLITII